MEIKNRYLDLFTWCVVTIFLALYSTAIFTPIIEVEILNLIVNYVFVIIFAYRRKRIKDVTSLDIVIVGFFFFQAGRYL